MIHDWLFFSCCAQQSETQAFSLKRQTFQGFKGEPQALQCFMTRKVACISFHTGQRD